MAVFATICCDNCGKQINTPFNIETARKSLKKLGWIICESESAADNDIEAHLYFCSNKCRCESLNRSAHLFRVLGGQGL